jgi:hypothetical protein
MTRKYPGIMEMRENTMRKLAFFFLFPVLLLLLPVASATTPMTASGNFSGSAPSNVQTRSAGGNMFTSYDVTFSLTGDISGPCAGTETVVAHPDGSVTLQGTCTFNGSIGQKSGMADFRFNGFAMASSPLRGNFGNTNSNGGLAGLHLQGTFLSTQPNGGSYAAMFHFE